MLYDFGFEICYDSLSPTNRARFEEVTSKLARAIAQGGINQKITITIVIAARTIVKKAPPSYEHLSAWELLEQRKSDLANDRHSFFRKYCYLLCRNNLQKMPEYKLQLFSWLARENELLVRPLERDELVRVEQEFMGDQSKERE